MLASDRGHSVQYSALVQDLTIFAYGESDRYLSILPFVRALRGMVNVRRLSLHVSSDNTDYILYCLHREGQLSLPRRSTLPSLRHVVLNSSSDLLPIASRRDLFSIVLTDFMDGRAVDYLAHSLHFDVNRTHLTSLRIRIKAGLDLSQTVLPTLQENLPKLETLSVEQPKLNAKEVLTALATNSGWFTEMQCFALNPSAGVLYERKKYGIQYHYRELRWLFDEISASRKFLKAMSIGTVIYVPLGRDGKYIEAKTASDKRWWNSKFSDSVDRFPQCHFSDWEALDKSGHYIPHLVCAVHLRFQPGRIKVIQIDYDSPLSLAFLTMLSAKDLKGVVELHWRDKGDPRHGAVKFTGSISCAFHKCVWTGTDMRSRERVVVKAIALADDSEHEVTRLQRLTRCLDHAKAKGLTLFVDILASEVTNVYSVVCLTAHGMSLRDVLDIKELVPLPLNQVKAFSHQILSGIQYLHTQDIIHTDITPSNVVLVQDDITCYQEYTATNEVVTKHRLRSIAVKLIDLDGYFDWRVQCEPRYAAGTRGYRAPEISLGIPWTKGIDIFSFGCTLWELHSGGALFNPSDDWTKQLRIIERFAGKLSSNFFERLRIDGSPYSKEDFKLSWRHAEDRESQMIQIRRPDLRDLLKACLQGDDRVRVGVDQALQHRFYNSLS
ncbi:CMGC/CLK protein kinase [Coprinopsis cinerea okayama7|uniref:CMGC/CLK protein kinase n=1 Tax=Coprinopsis cinerea (strain Okayama-7 / 130 / ATCC MYA-4618 / FGSC 9003) TaxID=240176 RepID=A8NYY0_COPC7|nr:CMGC/CLK protein kinase [Coprinopsis cinerea okayama7\|eukprot:XP_001837555.2 CMGC/CLK protein kinase [Coprinopsis cinerea okayama7\